MITVKLLRSLFELENNIKQAKALGLSTSVLNLLDTIWWKAPIPPSITILPILPSTMTYWTSP